MSDWFVTVEMFSQEESDSVAERDSAAAGEDGKEEVKKENSKEEAPEPKKVSTSPAGVLHPLVAISLM